MSKMKYDNSFDPPAPIAEIVLRNIETGERSTKIKMLLDTGADISLIPFSMLQNLQIQASEESVNLSGFDETESSAELYNLQIIFIGKRITGNYCGINDEIGILGRDVLNEFCLTFDGVNLEWKECAR